MVKEMLRSLGMTPNEAEIYLALLGSGELSVNGIASKAGLHRQVCYDALDRLLEKGFVSYIMKDNKKFFRPLPPDRIPDYLEEKKQEVNSALPRLAAMFKQEKEKTSVELIKGKNVLRTVYNDIFRVLKQEKKRGTPLYAMGIEETKFLKFDRIAIKQHIGRLRKNRLKEKLLSKESATYFFEGAQSEYRLMPDYLFNPNPTHIYGDKIAIIIWGSPAYGIIIENREVADANRKYFRMLWKIAGKRKK